PLTCVRGGAGLRFPQSGRAVAQFVRGSRRALTSAPHHDVGCCRPTYFVILRSPHSGRLEGRRVILQQPPRQGRRAPMGGWSQVSGSRMGRKGAGLSGSPWETGGDFIRSAAALVIARGSSSKSDASWSVIAPPSCSTSTMVTARR